MDLFIEAYKAFWSRTFDYSGYTSRKTYGRASLIHAVVAMTLYIFSRNLYNLYIVLIFLPSISQVIRRLRSAGKSFWSLLWALLPLAGSFILLYILFMPDLYGEEEEPTSNFFGGNDSTLNPVSPGRETVQPGQSQSLSQNGVAMVQAIEEASQSLQGLAEGLAPLAQTRQGLDASPSKIELSEPVTPLAQDIVSHPLEESMVGEFERESVLVSDGSEPVSPLGQDRPSQDHEESVVEAFELVSDPVLDGSEPVSTPEFNSLVQNMDLDSIGPESDRSILISQEPVVSAPQVVRQEPSAQVDLAVSDPTRLAMKDWLDTFQAFNGRMPSPEEFMRAKASGFVIQDFTQPKLNQFTEFRQGTVTSPGYPVVQPPAPKNSGVKWLLLALIPIIGLSILYFMQNPLSEQVVDLSDYGISTTVYWADGKGSAEVEVEWVPEVEDTNPEIEAFLANPQISISPSEDLVEGDFFEVELTLDRERAKELGLRPVGSLVEYYEIGETDFDEASQESEGDYQDEELEEAAPSLVFLSEDKIDAVTATSYLSEPDIGFFHRPENSYDGDLTTAWVEGASGQGLGESLLYTFKEKIILSQIRISNGYQLRPDTFSRNSRPSVIKVTLSDGSSQEFSLEDSRSEQVLSLDQATETSSVKISIVSVYKGTTFEDTALSEVTFEVLN